MSLYVDLQRRIFESDSEEAIEILQSIWEQRADMGQLTACFLEPASASLQLRFDTPHAMICLDSLSQLLEMIPSKDHLYFLEGFVRYLSGLPKISIDFKGIEYIRSLGVKSGKKGYVRSLMEHKVNNAFYYALRFMEEEGLEDFLHQCLEIASREVDFLGHVFIYTHTVSRLCRRADPTHRGPLVFQLTEFLARRARVEADCLRKEGRELDSLIPMALEQINILGHNSIFAHKISQAIDHLEGRCIEHLCSQLIRNVENSPDRFSRDDLEQVLDGVKEKSKDPLGALRKSLTRGNERQSLSYCRQYIESFGLTGELFSTLARFLAGKDPGQPHYLIFPQAIFDLAQTLDQPQAELALARVVRMITGRE
jgi:hypothetical protein